MKKLILKIITIAILIISSLIIVVNLKDDINNIINLFHYMNTITDKIKFIGILRIVLKLVTITYLIIVMTIQLKLLKNKEELIAKHRIVITILTIIGIILQYLNLSDYLTNILLMILIILEGIELLLITKKKIYRRIEIVFYIIYIIVIISTVLFSYLFCHKYELPSNKKGTSTNSIISRMNTQLWQMSTESEFYYNSFQNKKEKNNYNLTQIPGINYTETVSSNNSLLIETCTSMTPQGLVVTDKYIYVSAYCHIHEHNSVIYQIDKEKNKLIKTIVLPDTTHAGGLAYDDKNQILWIATKIYNTNKKDDTLATVSCITQDVIDNYNFEISKQPIRYYKTYQTAFSNTSFMTYHDGFLYTGLFTKEKNKASMTAKLEILEDGTVIDTEPISYSYIPSYVQSIAFIEDKILFVTSYGVNNSKIIVYENNNSINFIDAKPIKEIITPPMLEQIYPYKDELYLVFESPAYAYRYTPGIKIDHITSINKNILE